MDTPLRSSSVPAAKRRLVDIVTPDKDLTLANMLIDYPTSDYPFYVKIILDALIDTREQIKSLNDLCTKISNENVALRSENSRLKDLLRSKEEQLSSHTCPFVSVPPQEISSPDHSSPDRENELERKRSLVLSGVAEHSSPSAGERSWHDLKFVHSVLDHLNVECLPLSVFRMGRPDGKHPRLLKIVLPSSHHQQTALRRASRLRSFFCRGSISDPPSQGRRGSVSGRSASPTSALRPHLFPLKPPILVIAML